MNPCAGVSEPETCNFIKERLRHRCLPVNFEKFLKTPLFLELLPWLFLTLPLCIHSKELGANGVCFIWQMMLFYHQY